MLMMDDSPLEQYAPFAHGAHAAHTLAHAHNSHSLAQHAAHTHGHHAHYSPTEHLQVPNYFDFDLMKRSHDSTTDAANKKPRWSPGSSLPGAGASTASGLASSTSSDSSAAAAAQAAANAAKYANYGYGPNAPHHQAALLASQQHSGLHAQQQQQQSLQSLQGMGGMGGMGGMQGQGMYGQMGMGQAGQSLGMQGYGQQSAAAAAAMYGLSSQIPSITSAAAQQQQQGSTALTGQQTGTQQQQQQSINGSYTAPASPFVDASANGASPSAAAGFSFNGTPLNLGMMGGLASMQGMQGMMGMNNAFGANVGLGMGMNAAAAMNFNAAAAAAYGYDMNKLGAPGAAAAAAFYGAGAGAAAAAGGMMNPLVAGAPLNPNQRTVYIGNLPSTGTVDELLSLIRSSGPIESVRLLPEKNCAFISFMDASTALQFFTEAQARKLQLHGLELKIGWGKATPVPQTVAAAVMQYNASRNVYLGGLEDYVTEEMLREDLSRFGPIDQIKILKDKNVGFVHFLSIQSAIKAVSQLSQEPNWQGKRVNYGKDRCTYIPKGQQGKMLPGAAAGGMQPAMGMAGMGMMGQQSLIPAATIAAAVNMGQNIPFNPAGSAQAQQQFMQLPGSMAAGAAGSYGVPGSGAAPNMRTVYLGNIHPDTTTEDLCNAIRGGVLQSIRYMQDKHIAFVTFIDPAAALAFFNIASIQGLSVNNRRLKIGWGKSSNPLPPALAVAVQGGATRNVYVGNIDDWEKWSEERLKADFSEFGDIELINSLREKNCAWVNFTNISSAMKAIEAMRVRPEYAHLRVSYGKDRCANPPRAGVQGGGSRRNNGNGNGSNPGASGNAGSEGLQLKASPGAEDASAAAELGSVPPAFPPAPTLKEEEEDEYAYAYDEGTTAAAAYDADADEADAREAEHGIIVPGPGDEGAQVEMGH